MLNNCSSFGLSPTHLFFVFHTETKDSLAHTDLYPGTRMGQLSYRDPYLFLCSVNFLHRTEALVNSGNLPQETYLSPCM